MNNTKNRLLGILLTLALLAGLLPMAAVPVFAANPAAEQVTLSVGGTEKSLDSSSPYLVNGEPGAAGVLGNGGCTAHFEAVSGTLSLNGYNGGAIAVSGSVAKDLTVKLIGANTITGGSLSNMTG